MNVQIYSFQLYCWIDQIETIEASVAVLVSVIPAFIHNKDAMKQIFQK